MVKVAPVRSAFVDPDQVSALPDLIVLNTIIACGGGKVARHAYIRYTRRLAGH
jgi:hypothetical protein